MKINYPNYHSVNSIDRILKVYHYQGLFSGSALVSQGEKVTYKQSFGLAHRAWHCPNKPKTAFMVGSNTKQFTAMLVLQLVEKGLVDIHQTVDKYLPYFRKDIGGKITIHHLLTHTSGLPNYNADPSFRIDDRLISFTIEKMIIEFTRGELEFEPGSQFKYCNTGYYILGDIIEKITGKNYSEVLNENIVGPLRLENTGFFQGNDSPLGLATGYVFDQEGLLVEQAVNPRYGYSAGNIYSSVEDLHRWDRALYSEELLSSKYLSMMFTPYLNNYAFGWVSTAVRWDQLKEFLEDPLHYQYSPDRDERSTSAHLIVHRGMTHGYESLIIRIVDRQQLVVLLSNTIGRVYLEEIALRIISIMYDL
ncbi:MAG: beta-lactamase family protein [Firmicutes bacterium]|nr:beta-lactamase family protein [Bacillota bacterium]